jgi:hypothetical protein
VFFAASWGYLRLLRIPVINGGASTLPAGGGGLLHDTNALCTPSPRWRDRAARRDLHRRAPDLAAGRGLPGLALIAWTVVYAFSVRRAVHYIPLRTTRSGPGFEAMLMNGLLGAAGLALVVPLFMPSRWRSPHARPGPGGRPAGIRPLGSPARSGRPDRHRCRTPTNDPWDGTNRE